MKPITVLLVEDHVMVRQGLLALLRMESDIEVVGEAGDGREAVEMSVVLKPEVVVMDIGMPFLNGLEASRQMLQTMPAIKILILSGYSEEACIARVLESGAKGYMTKQTAATVLPEVIRSIHRGGTFFSPRAARHIEQGDNGKSGLLSSRESEILQLIAEGKANKETAAELKISIKTVEKHRQTLMNKLGIHDTAGLTRYAIAAGVIESSFIPDNR